MTKYPWSIIIRLIAFFAPLFLLHWYAKNAFAYAKTQEHHGDTGLGIAILLGLTSLVMLVGFFVDIVIQIRRKRMLNVLADVFILSLLLMPFGWFACNWYGGHDTSICAVPVDLFSRFLDWLNQ
ncbi:MAG: hypothetical protein ABI893_11140 [Polaromonas sp.]|uniref:hypothetical protein n=1 Tax=Polaromonas sp. TaxID=1869339 RepID=UPI003266871E